jgi:hypothetical protein
MANLDEVEDGRFVEALPPFADVVTAIVAIEPEESAEGGLDIENIRVSLPIELEIRWDGTGAMQVGGAPPLIRTRTAFTPVYHQLSLRITGREPSAD